MGSACSTHERKYVSIQVLIEKPEGTRHLARTSR
jgi:hypothetical protein